MKIMFFTPEDDLKVPPLSEVEKAWIQRLQNVLSKCPKRLELVTIGDAELRIVDRDGARKSQICDGHADRDGIVLAHVTSPVVHGVSG